MFATNALGVAENKAFMELFSQVINTDIEIMEKNEAIRLHSFRMK